MENALQSDGGMVRGRSGGLSSRGSMSTLSIEEAMEEEDLAMSSEASSYTAESGIQLGIGLSPGQWRFDDKLSSSSLSPSKCNISAGTKRRAESSATANHVSQVVGWPPVRSYRMNSLCGQGKVQSHNELSRCFGKNIKAMDEKAQSLKKFLFVKANMDGVPIGRKVDISAHMCYESLASALEQMFHIPTMSIERPVKVDRDGRLGTSRYPTLSVESAKFVLTYEDKDGDLMLVGDVPWGMFVDVVKRLRIMKISEAKGLSK